MNDTAPPLRTTRWFNSDAPITLEALRGRVIVLHAFQMLCPGCVSHGLPQVQRVHALFDPEDVAVIGLHTVFEHHTAMTPVSLAAFLHEYKVAFPVGVDAPGENSDLPQTMAAYAMRGTPTLVLIDRGGRRRLQHFGHVEDLALGAEIMALMREPIAPAFAAKRPPSGEVCTPDGCT
jgi:thiol-disulfide isomerase/thioredoxin